MISSDDTQEDVDPREIEDASDETPGTDKAPELIAQAGDLTEWDRPLTAGAAAPKVPMEDEIAPVEELVNEGLDEADRNQRMAAADPDMEP
jgi:hypothetical protein